MKNYSVVFNNNDETIVCMPRDKARSQYEYISDYGLQAVIARIKRTKIGNKLISDGFRIRTIITPKGEEITNF